MTFANFLAECMASGAPEIRLVPVRMGSIIRFYAHPQGGVGGHTVDYEVRGNSLIPLDFAATESRDSLL